MSTSPRLLIVSGHPASGKTTLATDVAAALRWPLFTKDGIKETLFDTVGVGDRPWSKRLGEASMVILQQHAEAVLKAGFDVVIEANFDGQISTPPLREMVARTSARPFLVVVTAEQHQLIERYRQRASSNERHPGHLDAELLDELVARAAEPHFPPQLDGPILELASDDPEAIERVQRFVNEG